MLTEYEKDALVAFFIRGERVLDFEAEDFISFAEGELMRPMPLMTNLDGCVTGDVCSYLCEVIERDGGLLSYPESITLLKMMMLRYEAVVAAGGPAAERLRNDIGHRVCKAILARESAQVLKPMPPVEKALPRVPALPTGRMGAARYYTTLWRRTNELAHVWGEVDPDSLGSLDLLCHGFDAELLDVSRAFDALAALRDALAHKCRQDADTRVAHLFMRASPLRRCIDRVVKAEVYLAQDQAPEWLLQAVSRFNSEFLSVLSRFAAGLGVVSYIPLVDAFAACADFWDERAARFAGHDRAVPRTFEWDYRYVVGRYLRYADTFAWDLNAKECARRRVSLGEREDELLGASLRNRFEEEERSRERAAKDSCARLLRRIKLKMNVPSQTLGEALTQAMATRPGDPLYPLCQQLRHYREGFGWSADGFRRICLTPPRRRTVRRPPMAAETPSAYAA